MVGSGKVHRISDIPLQHLGEKPYINGKNRALVTIQKGYAPRERNPFHDTKAADTAL